MPQPLRLLVFGFLFGLTAGVSPVVADMPEPEYLTVRNGLPQGFVNSIIQDRQGLIWMATRDGLCRYDGIRFRIYTHDPQDAQSLSFSSIYEIQEDQVTGKFWIRTENNNIDLFDPVTGRTRRVSSSTAFAAALNRNQLAGIQPDRAGNVWVATRTNGFFPAQRKRYRVAPAVGRSIRCGQRSDSPGGYLTGSNGFGWLPVPDYFCTSLKPTSCAGLARNRAYPSRKFTGCTNVKTAN